MNVWLNKFCPGFKSLPCKPHPLGNEYHSIADGDKGHFIMWRIRLVEGKDPPKLPNGQFAFPSKWEKKGYNKTVDLLLDGANSSDGEGCNGGQRILHHGRCNGSLRPRSIRPVSDQETPVVATKGPRCSN